MKKRNVISVTHKREYRKNISLVAKTKTENKTAFLPKNSDAKRYVIRIIRVPNSAELNLATGQLAPHSLKEPATSQYYKGGLSKRIW